MTDDRPTDDLCSVCGETHEPPECRIGGPMTDRPTDDLPARLDKMADLSASPAYAAIHRTAAARIRELEAAGDDMAEAESLTNLATAQHAWRKARGHGLQEKPAG